MNQSTCSAAAATGHFGNFFDDIANAYQGNDLNEEIVDGYVYSLLEDNLKNSDAYEKVKVSVKLVRPTSAAVNVKIS